MTFLIKNLFIKILESNQKHRGMSKWKRRNYSDNTPQFVKELIFMKYAIDGADWVETGTYKGTTTNFLSNRFPHVYTIEPEQKLYNTACKRFNGRNVTLFNDVSEKVLPVLLTKLNGDINFWLDGHYSAGKTFKGEKDCPIEDELNAIEKSLENFGRFLWAWFWIFLVDKFYGICFKILIGFTDYSTQISFASFFCILYEKIKKL